MIVRSLLSIAICVTVYAVANAQNAPAGSLRIPVGFAVESATMSGDGKTVLSASSSLTTIWDVPSAKWLYTVAGSSPAFHPDSKRFATSHEQVTTIWDVATGKKINDRDGEKPAFSADGKLMLTRTKKELLVSDVMSLKLVARLPVAGDGSLAHAEFDDNQNIRTVVHSSTDTTKLWNVLSGKSTGAWYYDTHILSPDKKSYAFTPNIEYATLRDVATGNVQQTFKTFFYDHRGFSADGKTIWLSSDREKKTKAYDIASGKLLLKVDGRLLNFGTSFDGAKKYFFTVGTSTALGTATIYVYETATGKRISTLEGHSSRMRALIPDPMNSNNKLVVYSKEIRGWNTRDGKLLFELRHDAQITSAIYSPDGSTIATASIDHKVKIWDSTTGQLLSTIRSDRSGISADIAYRPDSKAILLWEAGNPATEWNVYTGEIIHRFEGDRGVLTTAFSNDGRYLATGIYENAFIWDATSAKLLYKIHHDEEAWTDAMTFSPDMKTLCIISVNKFASLYNAADGTLIRRQEMGNVNGVSYASNGKIILRMGSEYKSWNANTGTLSAAATSEIPVRAGLGRYAEGTDELPSVTDSRGNSISWVDLDDHDWVVTNSAGLFDASPGAMDKLYFVAGTTVIEFGQLKERYYEPGLWKKVMAGEELRNVAGFTSVELAPEITVSEVNTKGEITINLVNKGGGIGEVTILINGKEIIKDARKPGTDPNTQNLSLSVRLSDNKAIVPGEENLIAVKAWNQGHWIISKGRLIRYTAPGKNEIMPNIYILACGVSDYTGEEIDLKYAAKDAEDMTRALDVGAKRLFGAARTSVHLLTTAGPKESFPTKANILKTFEKISAVARPWDVLVVYLSGHGINYGGQDGDFYYLTQDAYTGVASAYNDPVIRQSSTIASSELVEMFKNVAALKQVLIIDACGSGRVVDNLIAKRDIPSSTLRALDRMKDRTGMYIITGCAADAVSYEASKYGQGVLTYSLLEGIRGAALREGKFMDVNNLFQYAQERVPTLAVGIGGIQMPQVFSPYGSQSFDVGELSVDDKKAIPIAMSKAVFIRSNFIDKATLDDKLGLARAIDEGLRNISSDNNAGLIFLDVQEYPDGCKLSGLYEEVGGAYKVDLKQKCGSVEKVSSAAGAKLDDVVKSILGSVKVMR
jgi:WD40 repeat protein